MSVPNSQSTTTQMEDQRKPVTGYPPPGYPPAQPNYQATGYPQAQPSYSTTANPAYHYAAPPPAAYYNPTPPYNGLTYDTQRTNIFRRLIAAAIAVFLIIGTIMFIIWLVLRPRLPEFRVDSVSVSFFNVSDSQVTANWDVAFAVRNPNKKLRIFYDRVDASVYYRREFLADTSLAPFYQGKKNQTTIHAKLGALSAYVGNNVGQDIVGDRANGAVNFNVKLMTWARFKAGSWPARRHLMRVSCKDVRVGFSSNAGSGSLLDRSKKCEVDM